MKEIKSLPTSNSVSSDLLQLDIEYDYSIDVSGPQMKHGFENNNSTKDEKHRRLLIEWPSPNMITTDCSKSKNKRNMIEAIKNTVQEALKIDTGSSKKDELDITLRGYKVHLSHEMKEQSSLDGIADKTNARTTIGNDCDCSTTIICINRFDLKATSPEGLTKNEVENPATKAKNAIYMMNLESTKDELDVTLRNYAICPSYKNKNNFPCNIKDAPDVIMKPYVALHSKKGKEIKQADIGMDSNQVEVKTKQYAPTKRRPSMNLSPNKKIAARTA